LPLEPFETDPQKQGTSIPVPHGDENKSFLSGFFSIIEFTHCRFLPAHHSLGKIHGSGYTFSSSAFLS